MYRWFLGRWRRRGFAVALIFWAFWLASLVPALAQAEGAGRGPDDYDAPELSLNYSNCLGSWIWTAERLDRQACQLWRAFEIPPGITVKHARLRMTVDNECTLLLDGRELGRGAEWRELYDYDLTPLLSPGGHVLAVKAFNSFGFAGMLLGLQIELEDGRVIEVKSDSSWRIVPSGTRGWETATKAPDTWPAATVMAPFGGRPWWTKPENIYKMPTLLPIQTYFWQTGWFQITLLSVCGLVMLISLWLVAQLALHQKDRLLLQRERARIARDIHDDLGSRMTQLVLNGEVAQSELPVDSKTRAQLDRICEEAREVLSTVDEILWAVNPRRDTLRDFASYVCGYAQEFLKATPIQCRLDVDPEMAAEAFALPLRRSLLLAVKETLNNAVKYSEATELLLQIQCQGQRLIVAVQDNGKGFDQAAIRSGRNGLVNMTQRMNELGGTCRIASQPGQGCRIEFSIPLTHARRFPWSWIWKPKPAAEPIHPTKDPQVTAAPEISPPIHSAYD